MYHYKVRIIFISLIFACNKYKQNYIYAFNVQMQHVTASKALLGRGCAWRGWCNQHRAGLCHKGSQIRTLRPALFFVVQKIIKLP
ncbi:hypothetical protein PUN28_016882 [Cardiocondyla obscurior]|uniref:Secreted protein n=1 Tax=Cardiocondyla obscurior TaxID=286306 RepID=A0AAW2ERK2_9HYME